MRKMTAGKLECVANILLKMAAERTL